jgi:hypothetical protein
MTTGRINQVASDFRQNLIGYFSHRVVILGLSVNKKFDAYFPLTSTSTLTSQHKRVILLLTANNNDSRPLIAVCNKCI